MFSPGIEGPGGIAILVIVWIPLFLSLISLGIYYLVRLFAKDYAWIVTLLCVLFLLTSAVNASLTEA